MGKAAEVAIGLAGLAGLAAQPATGVPAVPSDVDQAAEVQSQRASKGNEDASEHTDAENSDSNTPGEKR